MLTKIWKDPVWSKVIAVAIITITGGGNNLLCWFVAKNQSISPGPLGVFYNQNTYI